MPEIRDPGKEQEKRENRRFISEKVVRPARTRRQMAERGVVLVLAAAVFGAVAAVSFAVTVPMADRVFGEEPATEPPISIPKDEPADPSAAETVQTEPVTESEPIEDQVQSVIENYHYTIEDLNSIIGSMRVQAQKVDKGIAVVHSVQQNTDWFDNPVETSGLYAGAVIAKTGQELLVLTPEAAVEQADSIKVSFPGVSDADGKMKQKDSVAGLAIVSVSTESIEPSVLDSIQVLPLGNSYMLKEGELLIAAGGPAGMVHSLDYGTVSYVQKNVPVTDQHCRLVYADIMTDTRSGTFLFNTAGEMVGWALEPQTEEDGAKEQKAAAIMEISDYKGILEKLTNGRGAPYFGIVGQPVSEALAESGRPRGIYVTRAVVDSPAYSAGIQNGDVITRIDGHDTTTMKEFQGIVENLECGQVVHVTVARNGREEFTQLEFQVTVGAR